MALRKVEKLSSTIEKILRDRGWGTKLKEYRIYGVWEKAVGKGIARHARPAGMRGKKLTVIVDSSAWMQQLSLLKPEIMGKVNQHLREDAVESITLKLGEFELSAVQRDEYRPADAQLGPEEQTRIEERVAGIADLKTRESLRHLMEKDLLNKKRMRK
jgi:predicted nucleic acid-binding Zn ribbon protein